MCVWNSPFGVECSAATLTSGGGGKAFKRRGQAQIDKLRRCFARIRPPQEQPPDRVGVTARQQYILRVRTLARSVAQAYLMARAKLGFPMAPPDLRDEVLAKLEAQQ